MKPADRSKLIAEAMTLASRAQQGTVLALRAAAGGDELDPEARKEMLARAVAREEVRLVLDLESYEQKTGERNRNNVRFRDGAMLRIGRSGKGNPYMRDHRQGDVTARGGTILASKTEPLGDGHYKILQTVELTDPQAVERALRGLMSFVSIAWNPIGPVMCSACNKPVLDRGGCWHWPGDSVLAGDTTFTVEWIYDDAELVETSEVSVPGVPSAGITGIRAALAALNGGDAPHFPRGDEPQELSRNMNPLLAALMGIPALGLAAGATEDDAIAAVQSKVGRLAAVESLHTAAAAELALVKGQLGTRAADDFIREGVAGGKIAPGSEQETALRAYFATSPEGAKALLAAQPRVTPVGEQPQAVKPAPRQAHDDVKLAAADERIRQHHPRASADGVIASLMAMGKSRAQAEAIVSRQLAPNGSN